VSAADNDDEWLGASPDDTDVIVLHRYFNKHADKIGKELLSYSKPVNEGDEENSDAVSGKHAWDALCAVLVELGEPMEPPRLSSATRLQHREYLDLMSRFAHRPTDPVRGIFIETDAPKVGSVLVTNPTHRTDHNRRISQPFLSYMHQRLMLKFWTSSCSCSIYSTYVKNIYNFLHMTYIPLFRLYLCRPMTNVTLKSSSTAHLSPRCRKFLSSG
jgi:hypothetical protein